MARFSKQEENRQRRLERLRKEAERAGDDLVARFYAKEQHAALHRKPLERSPVNRVRRTASSARGQKAASKNGMLPASPAPETAYIRLCGCLKIDRQTPRRRAGPTKASVL